MVLWSCGDIFVGRFLQSLLDYYPRSVLTELEDWRLGEVSLCALFITVDAAARLPVSIFRLQQGPLIALLRRSAHGLDLSEDSLEEVFLVALNPALEPGGK